MFDFDLTIQERKRLVEVEASRRRLPYRRDVDGHLIAMGLIDITPFDDLEFPSGVYVTSTGSDYVHEEILSRVVPQLELAS